MLTSYYNEIDPFAAQWLRNLSAEGHIAPGRVDEQDIRSVTPADIGDATQAHLFAGIGVWSYALRLAEWPDDAPVWTGSCPCQPFSTAGKRDGFDDERHLWPDFRDLIAKCRPPVIFGEQVAGPDGRAWLDVVRAELEARGYAVGAADLPAASVGAPHRRQRLFWVAYAHRERRDWQHLRLRAEAARRLAADIPQAARGGAVGAAGGVGHADRERVRKQPGEGGGAQAEGTGEWLLAGAVGDGAVAPGAVGGVGDARSEGPQGRGELSDRGWRGIATVRRQRVALGSHVVDGATRGFWSECDWLPCRDGFYRPAEPGTFPMAPRSSTHVGRLRGYGNGIVPQVAATFIQAFLESASC